MAEQPRGKYPSEINTKTVRITLEVLSELQSLKSETETVSDVIKRLLNSYRLIQAVARSTK